LALVVQESEPKRLFSLKQCFDGKVIVDLVQCSDLEELKRAYVDLRSFCDEQNSKKEVVSKAVGNGFQEKK